MILVALWAVPNAAVAWFMRSGLITGTSQQLREWTIAAFLGVNLVFAFFGAWFGLLTWLQKVTWYNQTGGVLPMPAPERLPRKQQLRRRSAHASGVRVDLGRDLLRSLADSPDLAGPAGQALRWRF